ncbi:hypothetical protein [Sphingomicrobium astaxanthinifaciens]|uniref:hypothetical protein n=1 Tax=Sphingomicrobium astaxanthinifaciens TaxID=1227949 RepID=UPI001FCC2517|nr:hypothetical protein [Sphingomicrobium astaxanthinifaciens]MCJ7421228.1 hypothetical protein [Sphingomicrobium astaxanthinifaciens]
MPRFSILYFHDDQVVDAETLPAIDMLEAIEHARLCAGPRRAEIWSGTRCVGEVGGHRAAPFKIPA